MGSTKEKQYTRTGKSIMEALKSSLRVTKVAVGGVDDSEDETKKRYATSKIDIMFSVDDDPPIDTTVKHALLVLQQKLPSYKVNSHPTNRRVLKIKVPEIGNGEVIYKYSEGFDHDMKASDHYRLLKLQ